MTDIYRTRTLSLLEKLGAAYVVPDEPQGFRSSTRPTVAATAPLALVRFHGRNAGAYEKPNIGAAERHHFINIRKASCKLGLSRSALSPPTSRTCTC